MPSCRALGTKRFLVRNHDKWYMKTISLSLLAVLSVMVLSGCINTSTIGSPILGSWETKVLGFDQSIRFESNGTGVLVTTLGQSAFQFQIMDSDTLLIRFSSNDEWQEKSYNIVNNNTLQYDGLTWTRQGSV